MKWFHKIFFNCRNRENIQKDLDEAGVGYHCDESGIGRFIHFEISHNDSLWPIAHEIIQRYNIEESLPIIKYNKKELLEAEYLEMGAEGHYGYPQPEDDLGYKSITYDSSDGCRDCGVGYVQQSPFRMKGEPGWGRRGFLQLNWVYDEFFVRPDIWHEVFRPFGIYNLPVLWHKKETALNTVVQLDICDRATSSLKAEGLVLKRCFVCGREKYEYSGHRPYPAFKTPQISHLFKTQEYFGDACAANKLVVVSQEMYRRILEKQVRGVYFVPMVDDPEEYVNMHLE